MPHAAPVGTTRRGDATHSSAVTALTQGSAPKRTHLKNIRDSDLAHCPGCYRAVTCASVGVMQTDGSCSNPLDEGDEKGTPGESRGRKAAGPKWTQLGASPRQPGCRANQSRGVTMSMSIPPAPSRSRAAWTAALGGLSLLLVACQDAVAPSNPVAPRAAASRSAVPNRSTIPDQYVVTFVDDVKDVPGLAKKLGVESNGTILNVYESALRGFSARLSPAAVNALSHNPNIESIEPDQIVEAAGSQSPAPWSLDRLDQRGATLDNTFSYANSGAGVTIYIVDTGIRIDHVDFTGRASYGYDFVGNTTSAADCNGHGTAMAGDAGGVNYGTAKGASLVSVRVLDCTGNGATSTIIAGLDWVARNHSGPSVANLSFGTAFSATLNQAVSNLIVSGVTVTVAAGDGGYDACQISPASTAGALSVGGMNSTSGVDVQMSYSNYGTCVDLFAPGYQVFSDGYGSPTGVTNITGTSPSAAFAAGAAAQYLEAHPSAAPSEVVSALINNATTGALAGLGTGSPNRLLYTGSGADSPPPPPPPPPPPGNTAPTASFTASCSKANCSFNASGSKDDNGIVTYAWDFGDRSTSSSSSPTTTHTYTTKGSYSVTVTLTVTDAGGLTGQTSKKLTIKNSGK